jgi:transposase
MERRRMQAADLFERDMIPAEIARQVGVSHQIVSDWRRAWRQGGREALRSAGRAGRKPKLSDEQIAAVEEALTNGAEANGYANALWTLPRVAEVIARVTGVLSPRTSVVCAARPVGLDLAAARPTCGRTQRRSDRAVGQKALAAVEKRARRQNALIVFEDESGVSLHGERSTGSWY